MSVPLARKVALQYYGLSLDPRRKPSKVEVNVFRSFGTGGWSTAPDGGRPSALARLHKLVAENWDEHIGTTSRYGRISMPQLHCYADIAYGDPMEEASSNATQGDESPKAGSAPPDLIESWMKAICDESPANYVVELITKEDRHLLLVNTDVQG